MEQILNDITALVVPVAKNLLFAVIVAFVGFKVVNFIVKKLKKVKKFEEIDPSAASFICSFISVALKIVVVVSVIAILGVPMSSVVALVASAGVAVGLAVQGALSNLVGGLMILLFKPFRSGDYIESASVAGTVRGVSVFHTILVTPDNKVITVPNGSLTNSVITNYSSEDDRRVDVEFTVDYSCDTAEVRKVLLSAANTNQQIYKTPAPEALILDCTDKGIKFNVRVWCKNDDYWNVRFELIETIRNELKNNNIDIPYPQLDVRVINQK